MCFFDKLFYWKKLLGAPDFKFEANFAWEIQEPKEIWHPSVTDPVKPYPVV